MQWPDTVIWWGHGGFPWSCQCPGRLALTRWRRDCGCYEVLALGHNASSWQPISSPQTAPLLFPSILLQLIPLLLGSNHRSPIWQFVSALLSDNPPCMYLTSATHYKRQTTTTKKHQACQGCGGCMPAMLGCYRLCFSLVLLWHLTWHVGRRNHVVRGKCQGATGVDLFMRNDMNTVGTACSVSIYVTDQLRLPTWNNVLITLWVSQDWHVTGEKWTATTNKCSVSLRLVVAGILCQDSFSAASSKTQELPAD